MILGWETLDTQQLLVYWSALEKVEMDTQSALAMIEWELHQRMEADGATAIAHDTLDARLVRTAPTYDYGRLRGLAELVPPEVLAQAFTPEHEAIAIVPDKWDARVFKTWKKYGATVAAVIENATIPGAARLVIKRKEVPVQSV